MKQYNFNELLQFFYQALRDNDLEQANVCIQLCTQLKPHAPEIMSIRGQLLRHKGDIDAGNNLIIQAIDAKAKELEHNHPNIQDHIRIPLFSSVVFLGGDKDVFFEVGNMQLEVLQSQGLHKDNYVLDIGSGCFRGGLWFVTIFPQIDIMR